GPGERLPAAGVDQGEGAPAPGGVIGHPVAGDAGCVLHHRLAAAENPVNQGGLANVGPADDRDHRGRDVLFGGRYLLARGGSRRFRIVHGHPVRAGSAWPFARPARSLGRPTIRPITLSRLREVESISTASAAITVCGASARSRRSCSCCVTAAVAPGSTASSALRRSARADSLAVRNTLTSAWGATTVPMSRPSATMPPPGPALRAMITRCIAIRCSRTCGTDATPLTALETSRVRIGPDTSSPSTAIAGASGSVPISITGSLACLATVSGSVVSSPRLSSHQVRARYIA